MAESYTKALRDKRDLERKVGIYKKEQKTKLTLIHMEAQTIRGGLLDLQSKTRGLNDTVSFITTQLREEKLKAEAQLVSMQKSSPPRNQVVTDSLRKVELEKKVQHHQLKLEWLSDGVKKPAVAKTIDVVNIMGGNKGFKAMLNKMRKKDVKTPQAKPETPPLPKSPQNICELIDHFQTLPKVYPTKPKKKKPKPTAAMIEQYAQRKKERELSMSYGTRRRIRRADHHCDTLKELYFSVTSFPALS